MNAIALKEINLDNLEDAFYPTEAIHQRIKVCDIVVIAG